MLSRDLGFYVKAAPSLAPVAGTGSAQNGAAVDRTGYMTAVVPLAWSTSGGVTGGTITVKVQGSVDGTNNWTDVGGTTTVNIPAGPNASGVAKHKVDLTTAPKFIRAVVDSDPTGGSPASIVAAPIILGGADQLPAV